MVEKRNTRLLVKRKIRSSLVESEVMIQGDSHQLIAEHYKNDRKVIKTNAMSSYWNSPYPVPKQVKLPNI